MGAEVNAGTGKETTSVYSRFLDRHLEQAFDVLQDMVLRPTYPDIDSERQVVIEEIAMYEDEPSDKVHDVLATAIFGDHPLGRPVIGRAEVIDSVPVPGHRRLPRRALPGVEHRRGRGGERGSRPHRRASSRARCPRAGATPRREPEPAPREPRAEPALPRQGDRAVPPVPGRPRAWRAATTGASRCGCSTRSSAARPRRGCSRRCARSAAWPTPSTPTRASTRTPGHVGIYVGTRPDNVGEAMDVIGTELRRIGRGGRERGGARSRAREREGPHHPGHGVRRSRG